MTNTEQGKAFEYACLKALEGSLTGDVHVVVSEAYHTAQNAYQKAVEAHMSDNLDRAAYAAVRVINRLEPQIQHGNQYLTLKIQTDAQGMTGDVRDVVCIRNAAGWEIGISCKHNHHAVKHSRLSATIDFGDEWLGIPCSHEYFNEIVPIFHALRDMRDIARQDGGAIPLWNDIPDKADTYYKPVLSAFIDELKRLDEHNEGVPEKLIRYMLGRYDFYKVITDDAHETTRVEAVNIAGTLNQSVNGHHSIVTVPRLKMPSRFYHIGMVPGSDNKLEVVCDEGWTLTMRIHNASSKIEPSLKFDVQLVSLPASIHAQVEPW